MAGRGGDWQLTDGGRAAAGQSTELWPIQPVTLSYSHTVTLAYSHTVTLAYSNTVTLAYSNTVTLAYSNTGI